MHRVSPTQEHSYRRGELYTPLTKWSKLVEMNSYSEPYPNQRVYTGTIVQDQATAHFGDSYTTYHIHAGRGQNGDAGPVSLTVRQSLTGLVTASTLAIETISQSKDAAPITQEIQSELTKLKIVITALETLVDRTYSVAPTRAALIPVQDVVTVLTQLILVFTELQDFLDQLTADSNFRLIKASSSAARLLQQLMRHQISLSLILQIIQWWVSIDPYGAKLMSIATLKTKLVLQR